METNNNKLIIKEFDINKLKIHRKNPREHPDYAIDKLSKIIQEYGWTNPILISKDGFILAGHARIKAAKKLNMKKVPVIQLPLKGKRADAYLIADNKVQDLTLWDNKKLNSLITELHDLDFNLELTGFNDLEIDNILNPVIKEKEFDENIKTENKCPKCGYEW